MPKLTSKKPEEQSFAIPLKKMVVLPNTYSMTIPEFCEQLALARHPIIDGELRIEEALRVQLAGGTHFSEEGVVDTVQNVALRRASTASVCSAALYTAVHDGRLEFIHPMTGGRLIVTPHIRPEQEIDSSCKSPWQQEAATRQVRLTDLVPYAKAHDIEIVWADVEHPMPRTSTRRTKTEERYQAWIDKACQIQGTCSKRISILELSERVSAAFATNAELSADDNTIRKQLSRHKEQILTNVSRR